MQNGKGLGVWQSCEEPMPLPLRNTQEVQYEGFKLAEKRQINTATHIFHKSCVGSKVSSQPPSNTFCK